MQERNILSLKCIYSTEVVAVRLKNGIFWFGILLLAAGLICFPDAAAAGAVHGLRTCGTALIPALFPYFVLSRLVISRASFGKLAALSDRLMRGLFGVEGGCLPALLVSFLGGYPVGAATLVSLYQGGKITKQSAQRALCFCNNSGPAFFLGVAGGIVLGSTRAGLALYCIHVLSALCAGILLAAPAPPPVAVRREASPPPPLSRAFPEAVGGSCAALLQISGLVIFFSVLNSLADRAGLWNILAGFPAAKGLLSGILELTSGILQLSGPWEVRFLACAFLLGWGGVCVHFQAASLWGPAGLRPCGYLTEKALHGLLSLLFAAVYLHPNAVSLGVAVGFFALCALFPALRKKRTGNLRRGII